MAKKSKSRYELKEKLGEGGMGAVWCAFDTVLNTDVALKLLLDANDATALKLFYDECHKQSALAHPNIVEIRDVGVLEEDGMRQPYLVMPLLRGATLASIIRSSAQPLSVDRCVDIITQACRGLHAAHDAGLLHRDIKPSNLFVLEDDSVKIIDFGVAHRLDVSRTVSRKGTLLYMSPEQLALKPLTRASDVFSLAVVCYETLTRKQPFLAASEEAVMEAIRTINPPPASSINPKVSGSLSQVLCKAMAKDPAHRFSSAKEFGEYLRRAHYDEALAVFDPAKFAPRLEKAAEAFQQGNLEFAQELISELESEGYITQELETLAADVKSSAKKRTIGRLIESARARVQDGEYRLALQRIHEALQLEPRNEDALVLQHDIEARRAEADIVDWLRVGQQHLEKLSFSHARQAVQRILEMKPGEERALHFLSQVERRESEVQRLRDHKREAYAAALEAEKRNDLTSALSKMREVLNLERQAPDQKEPGQLAAYQSLYNRLHAEHEAIAASYSEAKQALERSDFAAASKLCDKFLEKFPQHTLFKALKFDTEQRWRRAISMRLVQVEEAAESEADLDQRVRMLEEVVNENPEVPEFGRLLQGTREKRDLVNGIVGRARDLESRELYGEALVQWETLQTIYPNFPGLNFEIENVRLRRQLSERVTRKNQWISDINQAIDAGDFDEALRLLSPAVEEFPEDEEFAEMRAYIRQQQELAEQTDKLIHQGRRCLDEGEIARGLEKLRSAYEIGSKVKRAKPELVDGLLRAARACQSDPPQARIYLKEILSLDPGNHAAAGLLRFLDDQTEYQKVDEVLAQVRQLRSGNDLSGAVTLLEQACLEYPRNPRLRLVLREIGASRNEQRTRDLEVIRRKRLEADTLATVPLLNEQIASVEQIANRYGDDEEFQKESRMLHARLHTIAATTAEEPPIPSANGNGRKPIGAATTAHENPDRKKWIYAAIGGAALLLLMGIVLFRHGFSGAHKTAAPVAAAPVLAEYLIHAVPSGAHILHDGQEVGVASPDLHVKLPSGKTSIEARMTGYAPQTQIVDGATDHVAQVSFALAPVNQQLQVVGDGALSMNGAPATPLTTGIFSGELPSGSNVLRWNGKDGYDATFHVDVKDEGPATVVSSHTGTYENALLVSVAMQQARVYTTTAMPITIDGKAQGMADSNGADIDLPAGLHTIVAGKQPHLLTGKVESGNGRLLLIAFENARRVGSLTVMTNVDGVNINLLHGTSVVRQGVSANGRLDIAQLPPGKYTLQASAPSSEALDPQTVLIEKDKTATVTLHVKQIPTLMSVKVRTLPGANIFLDGKATGTTDTDGTLMLSSVSLGQHHLEAQRNGITSDQDINLSSGQSNPYVANLKLDRGKAPVILDLDPASSSVTVYNAKGELVSISGTHFDLPEGRYHFIARADGYVDRAESADVKSDGSTEIDLKLTPLPVPTDAPVVTGWDAADWIADTKGHTLAHHSDGIGLYNVQPARGKFIFGFTLGRGFLFEKPRVEWVANYHDPGNYLLFSLDHTGLQLFTVSNGKRTVYGNKITLPGGPKYQVLFEMVPGHNITFIHDGHKWKQISDWANPSENADNGKFGFKGSVTLTSFSYTR
ncbi:MAG TPA: protein kinase [Alloacidobacterium sp.]|nr:protein kinase [Alloacidobacterium sp.]